jgi:type II secretory pathway pseudopilin PulG
VVLVIVGITSAVTAGRIHSLIIQERVQRAATAVRSDIEAAFTLAQRNRRPIRIDWDPTSMQLQVNSRYWSRSYRQTNLGPDAYGLKSGNVSFSRWTTEVFPNGFAEDVLTITLSASNVTKTISMSRAGLVQVQ